jgi:hypothetical protein
LARVKGRFPLRLHELRCEPDKSFANTGDDDDDTASIGGCSRKRKFKPAPELSAEKTVCSLSFDDLKQSSKVGYFQEPISYEANGQNISAEKWFVNCPLGVVSFRDGIHTCHPEGKPSVSSFVSVGYCSESDTSLVVCMPHTGRTHQLRLHLELCGNPIANDPCYGGQLFYGDPAKRAAAVEAIQTMKSLGFHPLSKLPHLDSLLDDAVSSITVPRKPLTKPYELVENSPQFEHETDDEYMVRHCRYVLNSLFLHNVEFITSIFNG